MELNQGPARHPLQHLERGALRMAERRHRQVEGLLQRELAGEGYVRWRSRADSRVGIEFAFLDAGCRAWVLEEIAAAAPRSFIPS